jgi:diguanylate cyclase (GGDEF)-like protein
MTDSGTRAMVEKVRQKLLTLDGAIAAVGILALMIGFFVGSLAGWVVCGLVVLSSAAYFYVTWLQGRESANGDNGQDQEDVYSQSPEGAMKKLLFDDYQSSHGEYVVRVVDEEQIVIPSTKQAQPAPLPLKEETVRELDVLDFFDLDAESSLAEAEPRAEFHSLMNKVLIGLKEVLFAQTVAFFWVNREKGQMVLETVATDSKHFFTTRRFALEEDVVSLVATTGKPQLFGRVDPGARKDLIKYYDAAEEVMSLIAVPVFYRSGGADIQPVGVIVADSPAEDTFGQETLVLLGRFTKLVSSLIKSYTDKFDLLLESELLSSIKRMQDRVKSDPSEQSILAALADEANRLANWDFLTVTMYSDDKHGWAVQKVINKAGLPYVAPETVVDPEQSVVADVIRKNQLQSIPDVQTAGTIRFCGPEQIDSEGSFLCVPISSFNRCYGAVSLESRARANFTGSDAETIYRLVENAAAALEVLYMNDLVREYVVVDHHTGSMTRRHFLRRLEEEVRRAEDFDTELSFVSLAVDGLQEQITRYGKDGADAILNEITKVVRSNLRPYDTIGRHETDRLGILLIHTAASDAYLWSEKVRKLIASHVMTVAGKSFSVTVSVGVCGLSEGMRTEELISGTTRVLAKALEGGGNLVRVF